MSPIPSTDSGEFLPGSTSPDESDQPALLLAILITTAIAFVAVISRAWVRFKMSRAIGWDDHLIFIAMVLNPFPPSHPRLAKANKE
jgi:hypothetical protein